MSQRTTISFKARKLFNCRNIENWNNIRCWPWLRHTSVLIKYLSIQFSIYRLKCLEIKDLFHFLLSTQSYWYLEMLVQVHKNRQCFIFFSQKYPQKVWTLHNGNLRGQIWNLGVFFTEYKSVEIWLKYKHFSDFPNSKIIAGMLKNLAFEVFWTNKTITQAPDVV